MLHGIRLRWCAFDEGLPTLLLKCDGGETPHVANKREGIWMPLRLRVALCMSAVFVLASSFTASASFLGLENGDVIDSVGFTINSGGAVFTDTAAPTGDLLSITASADDITTTTPEVLTEINTGLIDITLSVCSYGSIT